jgi:hypothetical protein
MSLCRPFWQELTFLPGAAAAPPAFALPAASPFGAGGAAGAAAAGDKDAADLSTSEN